MLRCGGTIDNRPGHSKPPAPIRSCRLAAGLECGHEIEEDIHVSGKTGNRRSPGKAGNTGPSPDTNDHPSGPEAGTKEGLITAQAGLD